MKWGPIVARRLQLLLDGFNCCSTASIVSRRHQAGLWLETTTRQDKKNNLVELEASLAPAEAEVGAMAKADQKNRRIYKNT